MKNHTPYRIDYVKRSATSIQNFEKISIIKEEDVYILYKDGKKEKEISQDGFSSLIQTLLIDYKDAFTEEYYAFDYECIPENYQLKFFLKISFEDMTFVAIKGILPFRQPHYQDIVELFRKL